MDPGASSVALERSVSQQSAASNRSSRSYRSATVRTSRGRNLVSQPSSSAASSVAPSDKSLTSFPSFSPETPGAERFPRDGDDGDDGDERLKTATQESENDRQKDAAGRSFSIVDALTGRSSGRNALFEDSPLRTTVPGSLHQADDAHIERLIARHGAVSLVRQIGEDLAQRDAQNTALRRRADLRERSLRKIIRECGLSNMELETRLRGVEQDLRDTSRAESGDESGLTGLMSDAMQDTMAENAYGYTETGGSTIRGSSISASQTGENSKGTLKGWKSYIWGSGTTKRKSQASSVVGDGEVTSPTSRSQSTSSRRRTLQDDLFSPPSGAPSMARGSSRASSVHVNSAPENSESASLASLALRLVAGGSSSTRDGEARGRAVSTSVRQGTARAGSAASTKTTPSARAVSAASGPKSLMAMRRTSAAPPAPASTKSQAQELWGNMVGTPPDLINSRQESYGPVEMDAILPPESQPPTLTHLYNNHPNSEYLTDRFGFIYDQRRKKRQREAAQTARHARKGSRAEMMLNGRTNISPNLLDDLPSPKWSVSSDGRPGSTGSGEDRGVDEGKPKRWQDYLKIATFPTELLSHTPSMSASALEVMQATEEYNHSISATPADQQSTRTSSKPPSIAQTESGLLPVASTTTTAVDSETSQLSESEPAATVTVAKEDNEPVRLLLQQLSDVHDSLQSEKTVQWNDFLRKVRAERRREGEAAVAAAAAAAEARYERPAMILPETRVADGEMIGISDLGNKGKVGRAKWNEFKNLVLGGIPVEFRAKVWSECSGARAMRIPGYYASLVAQNGDDDDSTVVGQILMDIHRTLTDNVFFRNGPGVQKLNEVLLAYSRRNKDVGYCQGMNLITANLLLIMPSAEDAFWVLASIIESILPQGYYDHSLRSSRADQQVLRQFVTMVLPKLSAHLESLSIELEALTFQWFLSVFTDCLSAEALFRVWDVVLCTNDGSTFLFQVALALLKLNEANLLQCDTPAGVYTYINHQMTEHATSIDGLIQASEGLRRVVRREDVEQRREKALQAERDLLAEREDLSRLAKANKKTAASGDADNGTLTVAEPRPMEA